MKKSKLITVLATVLSVAVIATACGSSKETKRSKKDKETEETEETEETDETDEETKKTKKTKATTEESTEDTTEEPTTTTEEETTTTTTEEETTTTTTEAETSDTAAPTSQDLGDRVQHSVGSYTYSFSKEWQYLEKSIYQYFFEDQQKMDNFVMIYKQHMMTPSQLQSFGCEATLDEFNKQLAQQFGNGTLESCTKTDGGDKDYYEDIVIVGTYQGAAKKLPMHVILDKETGDCYVFCLFMDANLDSAKEAKIMELYNSCIASIERV